MDDQPKKKRKNKEDDGGQKEHKKNWREYMATAADRPLPGRMHR